MRIYRLSSVFDCNDLLKTRWGCIHSFLSIVAAQWQRLSFTVRFIGVKYLLIVYPRQVSMPIKNELVGNCSLQNNTETPYLDS